MMDSHDVFITDEEAFGYDSRDGGSLDDFQGQSALTKGYDNAPTPNLTPTPPAKWPIQKKLWTFKPPSPFTSFTLLNQLSTQHFATHSNFTLTELPPNTIPDFLSHQAQTSITTIMKKLEFQLKFTKDKNLVD